MMRFNRRAFSFLALTTFIVIGLGQACGQFELASSFQLGSSSDPGILVSWDAAKEPLVRTSGGYRIYYSKEAGVSTADVSKYPMVEVRANGSTEAPTSVRLPLRKGEKYYIAVVGFLNSQGTESKSAVAEVASVDLSGATASVTATRVNAKAVASFKADFARKFKEKPRVAEIDDHVKMLLENGEHNDGEILVSTPQEPNKKIKLARGQSVEDGLKEALKDPNVISAQPNYVYQVNKVPAATAYGNLWAMHNTGQTYTTSPNLGDIYDKGGTTNPGAADMDTRAEKAWDVRTDCSSVVVGVLDTGVNYTHQDLAGNLWNGNAVHGTNLVGGTDPKDDFGHGSHVAGTIGASGGNGNGVAGLCWKVQIMAVKILGANGSGSTDIVAQGIRYAADNGAKILNMSLGGPGFDDGIDEAIAYAYGKGVLVVVAAGNGDSTGAGIDNDNSAGTDDQTPSYPCTSAQPNVICVAAADQKGGVASFSNYGLQTVDIAAPGVNIYSTYYGKKVAMDVARSGWTVLQGTDWLQGLNVNAGSTSYSSMAFPANWDGTANYGNNIDARIAKMLTASPDLTKVDFAQVGFAVQYQFGDTVDHLAAVVRQGNANPFGVATTDSSIVDSVDLKSATMVNDAYFLNVSPACLTAGCYLGFQAGTNGSLTSTGAVIYGMKTFQGEYRNDQYTYMNGTSMATPHVTGLAALVLAQNPLYTALDIKTAIESSGRALPAFSGKIKTGKMIDAFAAVTYVLPVGGVKIHDDAASPTPSPTPTK